MKRLDELKEIQKQFRNEINKVHFMIAQTDLSDSTASARILLTQTELIDRIQLQLTETIEEYSNYIMKYGKSPSTTLDDEIEKAEDMVISKEQNEGDNLG